MSYYLMTNPGYMLGTILVGIAMFFFYTVRPRSNLHMRNTVVNKKVVVSQGHKWLEKY